MHYLLDRNFLMGNTGGKRGISDIDQQLLGYSIHTPTMSFVADVHPKRLLEESDTEGTESG